MLAFTTSLLVDVLIKILAVFLDLDDTIEVDP